MSNDTFKNRVIRKLEIQGYRVHPIWNDNNRCPFDLISVNPKGKGAYVKLKAHGYLTKGGKEKEEMNDTKDLIASLFIGTIAVIFFIAFIFAVFL